MVLSYPSINVNTPGVRSGWLLLVDRGEMCPILIGADGMACPCDGMYDLIDEKGEAFADAFEFAALAEDGPVTQFGVVLEKHGIRYAFVADWAK